MIAFVSGPVAALAPDSAVVEVGGIGIAVQCTPNTLSGLRMGQQAKLATSLVVREDSLTLYGFVDDDERQVFELLQTVTGVYRKRYMLQLGEQVAGVASVKRCEPMYSRSPVSNSCRRASYRLL